MVDAISEAGAAIGLANQIVTLGGEWTCEIRCRTWLAGGAAPDGAQGDQCIAQNGGRSTARVENATTTAAVTSTEASAALAGGVATDGTGLQRESARVIKTAASAASASPAAAATARAAMAPGVAADGANAQRERAGVKNAAASAAGTEISPASSSTVVARRAGSRNECTCVVNATATASSTTAN